MAAKKKATEKARSKAKKPASKRRRKGVKIEPIELAATELLLDDSLPAVEALAASVEQDGGAVLARYREPLGGQPVLLVSLPLARVAPTPFQRDVSDAHVRKLTRAMDKTKRFLDPIILVKSEDGYQTPNGNHRLTVMRELGAKAIVGLLVPERAVAYQILALNIEKAHNLRERALEVLRMYRDLQSWSPETEAHYELEFEEPALVTLGFAYEQRKRLAGGAYHPVLRKVDEFFAEPLRAAAGRREQRATLVLELDDAVNSAVAKLKERGLQSPYLKNFVIARVNPLRFTKGKLPSFEDLMHTMTERAAKLNTDRIKTEDLAKSGGGSAED